MFSRSLAASATREEERGTTCSTAALYRAAATCVDSGSTPPTSLGMVWVEKWGLPGSSRSGLKARKKSFWAGGRTRHRGWERGRERAPACPERFLPGLQPRARGPGQPPLLHPHHPQAGGRGGPRVHTGGGRPVQGGRHLCGLWVHPAHQLGDGVGGEVGVARVLALGAEGQEEVVLGRVVLGRRVRAHAHAHASRAGAESRLLQQGSELLFRRPW